MSDLAFPAFVSARRLSENMRGFAIIDASWHMPNSGRNGREEYDACHIPGAVFWDIDAFSDPSSPYPHMLPSKEDFAEAMGSFGVSPETHVVIYDAHGLFSAPRAWFTLRAFGHRAVSVLEGGLPAWKAQGLPTTNAASRPHAVRYPVPESVSRIATTEDVLRALGTNETVLDARPENRFLGNSPEPRPGVRSGHMPGAKNLPYGDLISAEGTLLPNDALRARFAKAGADALAPFVASCGSGVTACILAIAAYELGNRDARVYDGSWSEWGSRQDLPIA